MLIFILDTVFSDLFFYDGHSYRCEELRILLASIFVV
jgi:hypothetical protein